MLQHRVQLWLTATEAFKEFHRLFRTTASQDVIKERLTGLTVENAFLLKAGISVRRQYVATDSCSSLPHSRQQRYG
ncbi:Uncharacterised protein [Salmonella enterica subsp. enterica]|uniref:Uncharacterized protein n=1 Tax=Salmonella enterica I TaxID=59201 RepID=A0A447N2F9_SALET|nr:Uncharacterised protein [Salmonella enterica subsp. enterica]